MGTLALARDYLPEAFTTPGVQRGSNVILAEFGHPRAIKGLKAKVSDLVRTDGSG